MTDKSKSTVEKRVHELRRLREIFTSVASERSCQLVTLIGPAGIGKSRLAAELSAGLRHEARTVSGRCLPYGDGITFWPVVQIIGALGAEDGVRDIVTESLRARSDP